MPRGTLHMVVTLPNRNPNPTQTPSIMQHDPDYPDYDQNLMVSSVAHVSPFHYILWKLV